MTQEKKVVIITGAFRGIGHILTLHLASDWEVWPVCRTQEQSDLLRGTMGNTDSTMTLFQGDLREKSVVRSIADHCRRRKNNIHALIHCPGPIIYSSESIPAWAIWESMFKDNLAATVLLIRALSVFLHRGRIVLFGFSGLKTSLGFKSIAAYAAAKESLASLARSAAKDLACRQITVNVIAPGVFLSETGQIPSQGQHLLPSIPLGRAGGKSDITGVIDWLLSPKSQYVTGQVIKVAGGLHI
ncbi:SDR family oxidoreductase [bacterium]|nr:SDR family oxidoreductase [candidate division CSSED10-310 bacterium]